MRATHLIGADGGSSFVRKTFGIGFPGKTLGVRPVAATRPTATESSTDVPTETSSDSTGTPRTRREHRQMRTAAEKRLATAPRELHQLSRQVQRDLRSVRRHGETTVVVARSNFAELAVQSINRLTANLRIDRTDQ
ncbi:FAD-dependent monooxygenase [Streptomyces sp. NPDC054804]